MEHIEYVLNSAGELRVYALDEHNSDRIHIAAREGNTNEVVSLIESGSDIDIKDRAIGRTPLQHAAHRHKTDCAIKLIELGADMDAVDDLGYSTLHIAAQTNNGVLASYLISAGANLDLKTQRGETPLVTAVCSHYDSMVKLLLGAGADHTACIGRRSVYSEAMRQEQFNIAWMIAGQDPPNNPTRRLSFIKTVNKLLDHEWNLKIIKAIENPPKEIIVATLLKHGDKAVEFIGREHS